MIIHSTAFIRIAFDGNHRKQLDKKFWNRISFEYNIYNGTMAPSSAPTLYYNSILTQRQIQESVI